MNDLLGKSHPYEGELTADEKQMAMIAHILSALGCGGWVGPLIIWAIKKDSSAFVKQQAIQAIAWGIAMAIAHMATGILGVIPFVQCLSPFIWLAVLALQIAHSIVAGLRAKEGMCYEYPVTSKFVK